MPTRQAKRPLEERVFCSKPVSKQQLFRHRVKAIRSATGDDESERPRKRRRSQTTMTQLDLGRRSFFEVIGDSDGDANSTDESDATPKSKKPNRRSRLPAKTESQDTMTQFVKRSSDLSKMAISDSEDDEAMLSDVDVAKADESVVEQVAPASNAVPSQPEQGVRGDDEQTHEIKVEPEEEDRTAVPAEVDVVEQSPDTHSPRQAFRTPKKVRVLPVPSSRSPPDTHLSTQVTPRAVELPEQRSPLLEKSGNIQRMPTMIKESKVPTASIRKSRPTTTIARQSNGNQESPTKRKVRDFNARFAILEQENVQTRTRSGGIRPGIVRSSTSLSSDRRPVPTKIQNIESQYPMPGIETQNAWLQLPVAEYMDGSEPAVQREESLDRVECSQPAAVSPAKTHDVGAQASTFVKKEENEEADVIIPSSQTRRSAKSVVASATLQETSSPHGNEPSLPESTYNSTTETPMPSRNDTQDLASDQLMRETQQAFTDRVPSSPHMLPPSSQHVRPHTPRTVSPSRSQQRRPSQATTVDETMTYSSLRSRYHRTFTAHPKSKAALGILSSSPTEGQLQVSNISGANIASSPAMAPPELADLSSSPRLPEPKTPSILRNLRAPLRLNDLMSESLDQSYPLPPSWQYDDEEEDDGEL